MAQIVDRHALETGGTSRGAPRYVKLGLAQRCAVGQVRAATIALVIVALSTIEGLLQMTNYRVTLRSTSTVVVEASNPYEAAVRAARRAGEGVEIADVTVARGPIARSAKKVAATSTTKKPPKKRKPLSPEARARLAENLKKARAARARKLKAAKKAKRVTKKR